LMLAQGLLQFLHFCHVSFTGLTYCYRYQVEALLPQFTSNYN
jgi:hypothetical protein